MAKLISSHSKLLQLNINVIDINNWILINNIGLITFTDDLKKTMAKSSISFETISIRFGGHSFEKRSSNLNLYYLGVIKKTSLYFYRYDPILSKYLK